MKHRKKTMARIVNLLQASLLLPLLFTRMHASENPARCDPADPYSWTSRHPLVAHALGGIDGYNYTNSREAFLWNYRQGHRVFEADLVLTSDGHLVARHDWQPYLAERFRQDAPHRNGQPWSHKEFMRHKMYDTYTPLDIDGIIRLLHEYRDTYLITDTKYTDRDRVIRQFTLITLAAKRVDPGVLERIVPQIYHRDMLAWIRSVYPFPSVVYTLYQTRDTDEEILKFSQKNGIRAVSMSTSRFSPPFARKLRENGIAVYVHTVNSPEDMVKYRRKGADGFWTDFVTPDMLPGKEKP